MIAGLLLLAYAPRKKRRPTRQRSCGKRRFRDHKQAMEAIRVLSDKAPLRGHEGKTPVRAYECDRCQGWHITAQTRPGRSNR